MTSPDVALAFDDVSIERRRHRLVKGVSFEVQRGSVHALLGHNGAGKTTLMRGLAGMVPLTAGRVFSADVPAVLFGGGRYPADLTVGSIIEHRARLLGGADSSRASAALGVDEFLETRGSALSTGMSQRLAIALALMSGSRLFVLDEPTAGLDPQGVEQLRGVIQALSRLGSTVVVCSHDLAELELVCGFVTCLRRGTVTAHGTVAHVSEDLPRAGHFLRTSDDGRAVELLRARAIASEVGTRGAHIAADVSVTAALAAVTMHVDVHEITADTGLFTRIYDAHASAPARLRRRERAA